MGFFKIYYLLYYQMIVSFLIKYKIQDVHLGKHDLLPIERYMSVHSETTYARR